MKLECWLYDVSGSFRRGRGGGEVVVVGTGKGLHVRPSSPGATRVLVLIGLNRRAVVCGRRTVERM
jgi:hypothetical protein